MMKEEREEHANNKLVWDRMKSGDKQSLSKIFTFYYSDLYHYGIKIFNLPDLVKDSIQDLFLRIWEKRSSLGNVQNPKAYLLSSLRRKLFKNKEMLHVEISDELLRKNGDKNFSFSPAEFTEINEISQQLRQSLVLAINKLPERQRELIFLRFYHNLRYLEIAQIMEVNEQTVRNMMQRALTKLRDQMDRHLWEGNENMDDLMLILLLLFKPQKDRIVFMPSSSGD